MLTTAQSATRRLRRFHFMRPRAAPLPAHDPRLQDLSDQTLRDIGVPDDRRFAILTNREAKRSGLRAQAQGGPFFIPPA